MKRAGLAFAAVLAGCVTASEQLGTVAPELTAPFRQAIGCDADPRLFCTLPMSDSADIERRLAEAEPHIRSDADRRWYRRGRARLLSANGDCAGAVLFYRTLAADLDASAAERLHDLGLARSLSEGGCDPGRALELRPRYRVAPPYPRPMLREGVSGWASFVLIVGTDRRVRAVEPHAASHALFEAAAREALSEWIFGLQDGGDIPHDTVGIQLIEFELGDD